jgi:uncharacterized membrane protein YgcG
MPIWDHLEELRERVLVALLAAAVAIGGCFAFSKELVLFLEAPVADAGVRFLQLSPGEFFFTTFKVRRSSSSSSGGGGGSSGSSGSSRGRMLKTFGSNTLSLAGLEDKSCFRQQ